MSPDNVQALPPGTRLGDYRLDAMIGHGGFGITYRAFDGQLADVLDAGRKAHSFSATNAATSNSRCA